MARVVLENVSKSYGKTEVVHSVNATFEDGDFVVIVGPSGCGKSTVLRMIAGLEEISSGTVAIGEKIVNDIEPKDRKIAMVFQNYALYPHMSVFNNMAYGLKLRKIEKSEIKRRVQEAAELLQLADFLKRKPQQLSGGQRQRVAMGRALVRKPSVFLFDEPLSNLDAKLRHQMRVELKRLHQNLQSTMIYVTHDQVEAMTLADKIVVINDGHIEQVGSPEDIYNNPASRFVAGFIGSPPMNFLKVSRIADNSLELIDNHKLPLIRNFPQQDENLLAGIRPEKIKLSNDETPGSIPIVIEFIEKLGAGELLYSHIGDDPLVISMLDGSDIRKEKCWATLPAEHLYFFNEDSGRSI